VKTPWWDQVPEEARLAYEELIDLLEGVVVIAELPAVVEQAVQWHRIVNDVELSFSLQSEFRNHPDKLSPALRQRVADGAAIPVIDYLIAKDRTVHVGSAFDEYFEHYDAILSPASLGPAPKGIESTGNPIMQTVWTFGGLPSLNLPLLNLSDGLPLGLQAVGALHNDARLLRSARWLVNEVVRRSQS
jgi:Asp-tRNA(Asn)/Glu-tRNA(Gln) amidotransferase A subunit family amidase